MSKTHLPIHMHRTADRNTEQWYCCNISSMHLVCNNVFSADKREPGDSDTYIRAKFFFRDQFLVSLCITINQDT